MAERVEPMARGQAERLVPMLAEVLAEAGRAWPDLTHVAVGTGPGNFTGLRIAVACARGLALALGLPAIGVSAFEALRWGRPGTALVTIPAPRGRVYAQRLDGAGASEVVLAEPDALPAALLRGVELCVGDAARALAPGLGARAADPAFPIAHATALAAAARAGAPQPRPAPLYVRGADAAPASDPPPRLIPG